MWGRAQCDGYLQKILQQPHIAKINEQSKNVLNAVHYCSIVDGVTGPYEIIFSCVKSAEDILNLRRKYILFMKSEAKLELMSIAKYIHLQADQ